MLSKLILQELLTQPIAFHRVFAKVAGGVAAGVFLSQAYYWTQRMPDGWFYKTIHDWTEETTLSRAEIQDARRKLKASGILLEKLKGQPARLYYKIDFDALAAVIDGESQPLTGDEILSRFKKEISNLSKSGLMTARKSAPDAVYFDYAEVLKSKGNACGICGREIVKGIGSHDDHLTFDQLLPIAAGGNHSITNLQPAHVACHRQKITDSQFVLARQTCLSSQDEQVCLAKTNKSAYARQTFKGTENNTENNTKEPHTPRPRANANFENLNLDQEPEGAENLENLLDPAVDYLAKCRAAFRFRLKTPVRLPLEKDWENLFNFWFESGLSAENLIAVYDTMLAIRIEKRETWQINPKVLESRAGQLETLKIELENLKSPERKKSPAELKKARSPEKQTDWQNVGKSYETPQEPQPLDDDKFAEELAILREMHDLNFDISGNEKFFLPDDWRRLMKNLEAETGRETATATA